MNAKEEFIYHIEDCKVKCAEIILDNNDLNPIRLRIEYTQEEYEIFLKSLEFNYNDGYGRQELFGTIWYTDETWSDRGEYDGSEWWQHQSCPDIPDYLK